MDPITITLSVVALIASAIVGILTVLFNKGVSCSSSSKSSCLHHCLNSSCCVKNVSE